MPSPPGKVALVTGSSRGLGRAIALRLADEGVSVVVNGFSNEERGRSVVAELEALGARAMYCHANVRDFDQVKTMVAEAIESFGPISILVNNAGWMIPLPFEENDPEYWDRVLETKIHASLYCVSAVLPQMKELGWGKIVNITGDAGRVGLSNGVVHTGAQGALQSMTKSWAREFAKYGIRVNAVSPGPTLSDQEEQFRAVDPDLHAAELMIGPLGLGKPEDISAAAWFLISEEADHITGQILSVNGGRAYAD